MPKERRRMRPEISMVRKVETPDIVPSFLQQIRAKSRTVPLYSEMERSALDCKAAYSAPLCLGFGLLFTGVFTIPPQLIWGPEARCLKNIHISAALRFRADRPTRHSEFENLCFDLIVDPMFGSPELYSRRFLSSHNWAKASRL